nr:putative reverse transcriptase domain-containing protein [Tanacetum cinerariifolium]
MTALIISIYSDISVESVRSSFPRVILIGSISVEVPVAPEVGAAAVASPAGVLELDTYSLSKADPSESSSPPVSVALMAMLTRWRSKVALRSSSPTTSILKIPTAPILPTPSATVASSSEFPLAPVVAPPGIRRRRGILIRPKEDISIGRLYRTHPGGPCRALTVRNSVRPLPSHCLALRSVSLSGHTPLDTTDDDSSIPSRFVHPSLARTPRCREAISVGVDRDVDAGIDACIGMEVDVGVDVKDEVEDEVESSDRGNMEVEVDVVSGIDIPDGMLMPDAVERLEQEALAVYEATRAANALEAESQSQNSNDGDNGNGGNGKGGNVNPNEKNRDARPAGYAMKDAKNKRRLEVNQRDNRGEQPPFERPNVRGQNVARAYTAGNNERKPYNEPLPLCNKCKLHHEGPCTMRCGKCNKVRHLTQDCKVTNSTTSTSDCPKLKDQNHGNKAGNKNGIGKARGKAYSLGRGDANPDLNVVKGTFLLNNHYTFVLFDSGAERSFVSTTFSTLLDETPDTLDVSYAVELANERISETNTILKGCTLGFLGHPFNIDLMPVELGSFDVIISMEWLVNHHAAIITKKETKDKSGEKRLKDGPTVRDFLEVFPEDLPGLPPTRQVEFQIKLVPGAAPVVRALYRLAPSELQELSTQLQELSDKGFIRLRLAGYYRRFIKGFLKIAKPMTKLTQKNVKFNWSEKAEAAFELLKKKLCSAPILALPKGKKEENFGTEDLCGMIKKLKRRTDGTLCLNGRSWIPCRDTNGVIVDRLMKFAHFLQMKETDSMEKLTRLYLKEVVSRHGVSVLIIFYRDSKFTSHFWQSLNKALGWDRHLPLVESSYNNSYHTSIKVAPFEALYSLKCRSPIYWAEVRDAHLTSPEIVHETTKKIIQIKKRIQAARDRQKSYADRRRKPLEFEVGDKVMLKVSPWKGVKRFGKREKLNPRYIRPFKILTKVGMLDYRIELPSQLSRVHSTFHVSNLKKCFVDEPLVILLDEIQIDDKLKFIEDPVEIMDREVKRLKQSRIPIVKVCWNLRRGPKFTWEREDKMKKKHPHLSVNLSSMS